MEIRVHYVRSQILQSPRTGFFLDTHCLEMLFNPFPPFFVSFPCFLFFRAWKRLSAQRMACRNNKSFDRIYWFFNVVHGLSLRLMYRFLISFYPHSPVKTVIPDGIAVSKWYREWLIQSRPTIAQRFVEPSLFQQVALACFYLLHFGC